MRKFDTVGIDCVAMTVNDLICLGCEPVALLDYIGLENEDDELVEQLAKGLVAGAKEAGAAIVGGETAIVGDILRGVDRYAFDLVSMGVGVVETGVAHRRERYQSGGRGGRHRKLWAALQRLHAREADRPTDGAWTKRWMSSARR